VKLWPRVWCLVFFDSLCSTCEDVSFYTVRMCSLSCYTYGDVTSQCLWSRYDRHFVGIDVVELNGEDFLVLLK